MMKTSILDTSLLEVKPNGIYEKDGRMEVLNMNILDLQAISYTQSIVLSTHRHYYEQKYVCFDEALSSTT